MRFSRPRALGLLGSAALSVVLLGVTACAPRAATPTTTLKAYIAALETGDYERAYRLMSRTFRKEFDRDEFVAHHKKNPKEVERNLQELRRTPSQVEVKAEYEYGDGHRLALQLEGGVWKLALDPVVFYSQRSPREALRSFVRAMERRRYAVVLRFVPNQWARVMTVEDVKRLFAKDQIEATTQLLRNLRANIDNKIEVKGDEAVMLYGDRFKVQFTREDGIWKIVDAD
jgi:hypothetical protein